MNIYFVYIAANWTGDVVYIGVTNNLERRIHQHKDKSLAGFTKTYSVDKLVYYEAFGDIRAAIIREKQLKKWRRSKKNMLIEKMNPQWRDLSEGWYEGPSASLGMTVQENL